MTGGQAALSLDGNNDESGLPQGQKIKRLKAGRAPLRVIEPNADELAAHEAYLDVINKASGGKCVWVKD
jgi:DNA polymerase-3 subunit epsilon